MVFGAGGTVAAPIITVSTAPLPTCSVIDPARAVLLLTVKAVRYPLGFCWFRLPSSSCCSSESVGDPYSGSGAPEASFPSCVFIALIKEL